MERARRWILTTLALLAGCSTNGAFACMEDAQCADGAEPGVCVLGWCGFDDDQCASGHRFGEHAGDGLAGTCVPPSDEQTAGTAVATAEGTSTPSETDPADTGPSVDSSTGADGTEPTTTTGPVELPDPIAWYTFDDPDDPWADASGNELHAWCGDPECGVPDVGLFGGAIRLDGDADHGHVDHEPLLDTYEGFTVAAWAWPDGVLPYVQTIISKPYGDELDDSWKLGMTADQPNAFVSIHPESWGTSSIAPWPGRRGWHHVAATWDGEELRLYLDGSVAASAVVAPIEFDTQYILIGAGDEYGGDAFYFGGLLDEVRLYDVALLPEQLAALASG